MSIRSLEGWIAARPRMPSHGCWRRSWRSSSPRPAWCRAQERAAAWPGPDPAGRSSFPSCARFRFRTTGRLFNVQMVNASLLPRDKDGIWVLDFAFKPLRIKTVDIPGKGRRQIHYLYYKVVNRTGKPRMFVPQFIMVNEAGEKFEDNVVPEAIPHIQMREDATIPILGAVNVMGMIPPSTKPDVDDAVFGVATWDKWDPEVRPVQHLRPRPLRRLQRSSRTQRRQAGRQVQDLADRLHPPRRRSQPERKGNSARRPCLTSGSTGERCAGVSLAGRSGSGPSRPSRSNADRRIWHASHRPHARPSGLGS